MRNIAFTRLGTGTDRGTRHKPSVYEEKWNINCNHISCSVNPSNLVAPVKVNDMFKKKKFKVEGDIEGKGKGETKINETKINLINSSYSLNSFSMNSNSGNNHSPINYSKILSSDELISNKKGYIRN